MSSVYILGGARTASGSFLGQFCSVSAPALGAAAISGAIDKSGVDKEKVEEVFMGEVVTAGVGQAPARQAAMGAKLDVKVPCTTINKVCGSGMKAIICGAQSIKALDNQLVVCGGMESMSMAPHLIPGYRMGQKFGQAKLLDAVETDGLWDVYSNRAMGNCAEECAKEYDISRESQDEYSIRSFQRAQDAINNKIFESEITPVVVKNRKGETVVETDEGAFKANFDKIPQLRPAFEKDGTITAANASTLNDGAAAIVLGGEEYKSKAEFELVTYSKHAQEPTWFTTAPVMAMEQCLKNAKLELSDIDLFEINEAFALVPLVAIKKLGLDTDKVNVYGGGVSLGHPIGCSGTRIVVTLMNAMKRKNAKLGMASICIGGGEALSLIIKRM
jgi:acetyl-CoA C-acetyltransferase